MGNAACRRGITRIPKDRSYVGTAQCDGSGCGTRAGYAGASGIRGNSRSVRLMGRVESGHAQPALSGTRYVRAARPDHRGNSPARGTAGAHSTATKHRGGDEMSSVPRPVDLTQVPAVPWAWVDERTYA